MSRSLGIVIPCWITLKCHQMLPGQPIELARQLEAIASHLFQDLLLAHFVQRFDGNFRVLFSIFHQHDFPIRFERLRIAVSISCGCDSSW